MQCTMRTYTNVHACREAQRGKAWENCIEGPGFTAEGETTDRRERRLVGRSVEAQRGKQRRVFHDEWGTTERRESQGGK